MLGAHGVACSKTREGGPPVTMSVVHRATAASNAACCAGVGGRHPVQGSLKRTVILNVLAGGGLAFAVKVTGARAPAVAVSDCTPAEPSRHAETVARPSKSEIWVGPTRVPPPWVTANVTEVPATGFPSASVTRTAGRMPT